MNKPALYKVRVTKDHLVFSAAHFITFNGNICERLHGHNWRVAAELTGPLDENGYVFDFIALRDQLQKTVDTLDHRVLLPTQHQKIKVSEEHDEIQATFEKRRWVFPKEDCILLPLENTTAELIARWIGQQLLTVIGSDASNQIESVQIEVEENFGQWAICQLPVPQS
ncbi:MAG: 6-pyruvoyl tetrahydropterin synthase family protein [Planctomycetes bacterium]|nr:6-pyruvoyl tetrahydropterin synthase family protein [Planctomycetota bacterium]MCH9724348.1 6-pyruvoyl tetrahydropterin synthase family protein [Planctomycetota bacterium]MCH9777367.1 6-pyruvoyl tetrahydropterin synthase family protein [Planctomycetota bacterium]MCH9793483.1 6-pyruvoyl tetrahydropterin synthase family protein [Planctomycetota bacterium]MDF1745120.1 6-pyruvoyl tetrahydropterin synthase family protein [Gimesia sp.]